jgi:Spy/CpxP family protein refolding chaperone
MVVTIEQLPEAQAVIGKQEEKMLRRWKLVIAVMVVAIAGAVAFSQMPAKDHGDFEQHMLNMMTEKLGLTDAQQSQAKQIFDKEKPTIDPLMQQMKQVHDQLRVLEQSGIFDEAKVRTLATQQAQIMTELTVEKARVHSQLFQILTPDQRTEANKLMESHHGWHGGPPPDGPPADN